MKKVIRIAQCALIALTISSTTVFAHGSYSTENEFKNDIVYHMGNRDTTFTIGYKGDISSFISRFNQIMKEAYSSDDYLSLSFSKISPSAKSVTGGIEVTLNVDYLSTKAQEDYTTNELSSILNSIITPEMNDFDKVRAINDYIKWRYSYDYSLQSRSVYTALTTSMAVCQNYSMTMNKMLNMVGVSNRIVVGDTPFGYHAWNVVNVDGKWYNVDTTNNDALKSDKYFLVSDDVLITNGYTWDKGAYPSALKTYEKPTTPTTPTEPTEPTEPVEPVEPVEPTEPSNPTEPVEEPNNPTEPTEPTEPVEEPTQPSEPVNSIARVSLANSTVRLAEMVTNEKQINKAKEVIALLNDSPEKTELLNRINTLEATMIRNNQMVAEKAVYYAEKYKTQNFINIAESALATIPDDSLKTQLTNRLNIVKNPVVEYWGSNSEKSIDKAKKAVEDVERYERDYFITKAEALIVMLSDCEGKTELIARMKIVTDKVDANYVKGINMGIDMAIKYNKRVYLDVSQDALKKVKNKDTVRMLQERIDEVGKLPLK